MVSMISNIGHIREKTKIQERYVILATDIVWFIVCQIPQDQLQYS